MTPPGFINESPTSVRPPIPGQGVKLYGSSSGFAGFKPAPAAGGTIWQLPTSDLAGVMVSDGSGNLSFSTSTGGVTSVNTRTGAVVLTSSDVGLNNVTNALQLVAANNLSDLGSASTARGNLGLGTAATHAATDFDPAGAAAAITLAGLGGVPTTRTVNGHALSANVTVTASDVGLGSVTNDAQTKATIVPNTAPSAGQILAGNAGGTAYAPVTVSGSGATFSLASTGVLSVSAIANASLSNSAITIAGTSTALGGSISLDTISGVSGNGFLKRTAANTWTNDSSTYLTANQTITLSGVVAGSGSTAITTTIANGNITNAMLANSSVTIGTTAIALGGTSLTLAGLSSVNKVAITAPATSATLTIADGKTLTASNTITFTATDGSTLGIGGGGTLGTAAYQNTGASGATIPFCNGNNTWGGSQTFNNPNGPEILMAGNATTAAWGSNTLSSVTGVVIQQAASTYTDNTTAASTTLNYTAANTFNSPTFAATNTGVVYSTAYNTYFGKPIAGTNVTLTNPWAIGADNIQVTANSSPLIPGLVGTNFQVGGANGVINRITLDSFANSNVINYRRANNTNASPSALAKDDIIGQFSWVGHDGAAYSGSAVAAIAGNAAEAWTTSAHGSYLAFFTLAKGSVSAASERMRIDDAGNVVIGQATATAQLTVFSTSSTNVTLDVLAASSTSVDIQRWKNSAGTVLSRINSSGQFVGDGSQLTGLTESQITNLTSDLALKAALASPTFTGVPAGPTATAGTNTTQLATTAFVMANGMTGQQQLNLAW